jgi:two-component system, NarL family, sensor kinase
MRSGKRKARQPARKGRSPVTARVSAPRLSTANLRARVAELEETLLAIRGGHVDALVINSPGGDQVFTLQGAEHPYRVLVESINEGAATLDRQGTVLYSNARFAEIVGVPLEKFIGTALQSHVAPQQAENIETLIAGSLHENTVGDITLGTVEGRMRSIGLSLSPVRGSHPLTLCVVATELTELVEANEALKANEDALRQLSSRLLQLQDDERRHIARDLHDITGQKLAVLSISLSQVLNSKSFDLDEEAHRTLAEAATLTHQIGEEIRTLSYLLHPPLLDELGLASAVKWYTQGFESRTGIKVHVDIPREFARLLPDVEVTLFRIVQESLTNVHRYSGSEEAFIRVVMSPRQIALEIGDSGKGIRAEILKFGPGVVAPLGVGIQGMKERMRQLSGRLEITRRATGGTLVTATLPRPQDPPEDLSSPEDEPTRDTRDSAGDVSGSRKRILIADDHELLRQGVRTLLQTEPGLEICGEAVDGKQAVEKAVAMNADLVILDINLPVLNGLAATRQILRNSPKTKILVFTVHESDQTVREILSAGAHGYLSKAQAGQDLLRVVKELLEGAASHSSTASQATA